MPEPPRTTAAASAGALGALLLTAPSPRVALGSLAGAGSATDPTAPLVAAVALLAWAVAGWLALTVVVVLLSRVPGLLGRTARALAGRVAPATVRRAVEAALGITVAVGVVAPHAALATTATLPTATLPTATRPSAAAPADPAEAAWDLDWPSRTAAPTPSPPPRAAPGPAATTPRPAPAVTATRPPPPAEPPRAQPAPVTAPSAVVRHSRVAPAAGAVVVRRGDTLWSLAEASLRRAGTAPTDRQVALAWPRWWAANREAVGGDPDLLLPGTVLRPPGSS